MNNLTKLDNAQFCPILLHNTSVTAQNSTDLDQKSDCSGLHTSERENLVQKLNFSVRVSQNTGLRVG